MASCSYNSKWSYVKIYEVRTFYNLKNVMIDKISKGLESNIEKISSDK